jgi:hypothetical protein
MATTEAIVWKALPAQAHPDIRLEAADAAAGWAATIRADGCVDLRRWFNDDDDDTDELHLCDLAATIARLAALGDLAREHFGPDWGR